MRLKLSCSGSHLCRSQNMMIVRVAQLATTPRLVIDPLGRFENEFALVKVGDVVSPSLIGLIVV